MLNAIIELIRAPYEAAKRQAEDSTVGQSDWDRSNKRFWKWFAWIFTSIIVGIPATAWFAWKILMNYRRNRTS
jgi:hypothetical protein